MGSTMRRHFIYPVVALPLFAIAYVGASLAADPTAKAPVAAAAHKKAIPAPAADAKPAAPASDAKEAADSKDAADGKDAKDSKDGKSAKNGKKEKKPVVLAKTLFGVVKTPAPLAARAVGFYSKGCLAGGVQLSDTGDGWQTMRPSR